MNERKTANMLGCCDAREDCTRSHAIVERLLVTMPKYKPVICARSFFLPLFAREIKKDQTLTHKSTQRYTHIFELTVFHGTLNENVKVLP